MCANNKMILTGFLLILIMCLCACSNKDISSAHLSFDQLAEGYSAADAEEDGCIVFEDSKLISGEDIWNDFMITVERKQPCCIRIAQYYSEENNLCLTDLSYNISSFEVSTNEGLSKEYRYLNHYKTDSENSDDSMIDRYVLTNQKDVKYDEIELSMKSSFLGDAIDHYVVYCNLT